MPYTAMYINPLVQFGVVNLTLILSDTDGTMPGVRMDKKFRDPEQITEVDLATEAQKSIDWAIAEYKASIPLPEAQS